MSTRGLTIRGPSQGAPQTNRYSAASKSPRFPKTRNVTKAQNAALPFLPWLLCPAHPPTQFWACRPSHRPSSSPAVFGVPNNMASCSPTLHPGVSTCSSGQCSPACVAFFRMFAENIRMLPPAEENRGFHRNVLSAPSMRTFLSAQGGADAGPKGCPPAVRGGAQPPRARTKVEGPEASPTCLSCAGPFPRCERWRDGSKRAESVLRTFFRWKVLLL